MNTRNKIRVLVRPALSPLLLTATIAGLSACGAGSGEGLDENGVPIISNTPDDRPDDRPSIETSLDQLQADIFSPICAQCHVGNNAPQGLRLDSLEFSFSNLVDVDSQEVPSLKRVAIGDPENSYIVHKIEGRSSIVGSRMPLGQPALSDEQIQAVRDWIEAGAERAESDLSSTRLNVTSAQVTQQHISLTLKSDRKLDPESVFNAELNIQYIYSDFSTFESQARVLPTSNGLQIESQPDPDLGEIKEIHLSLSGVSDQRGRYIDGNHNGFDGGELNYVYHNVQNNVHNNQ